ncbi:hypothetical protein RFI_11254, partial [Reticulomyxa filosa]
FFFLKKKKQKKLIIYYCYHYYYYYYFSKKKRRMTIQYPMIPWSRYHLQNRLPLWLELEDNHIDMDEALAHCKKQSIRFCLAENHVEKKLLHSSTDVSSSSTSTGGSSLSALNKASAMTANGANAQNTKDIYGCRIGEDMNTIACCHNRACVPTPEMMEYYKKCQQDLNTLVAAVAKSKKYNHATYSPVLDLRKNYGALQYDLEDQQLLAQLKNNNKTCVKLCPCFPIPKEWAFEIPMVHLHRLKNQLVNHLEHLTQVDSNGTLSSTFDAGHLAKPTQHVLDEDLVEEKKEPSSSSSSSEYSMQDEKKIAATDTSDHSSNNNKHDDNGLYLVCDVHALTGMNTTVNQKRADWELAAKNCELILELVRQKVIRTGKSPPNSNAFEKMLRTQILPNLKADLEPHQIKQMYNDLAIHSKQVNNIQIVNNNVISSAIQRATYAMPEKLPMERDSNETWKEFLLKDIIRPLGITINANELNSHVKTARAFRANIFALQQSEDSNVFNFDKLMEKAAKQEFGFGMPKQQDKTVLLVPYTTVQELENIKTTRKNTVRSQKLTGYNGVFDKASRLKFLQISSQEMEVCQLYLLELLLLLLLLFCHFFFFF